MKKILLLILVLICGGTPAPSGEPAPTNDVALEITIGKGRVIVAPPESYRAGSKWIEHSMSYKNTSKASVWIYGHAQTYPFLGIQTRAKADEPWKDYDIGYCGEAKEYEIKPGKSYTFKESLQEEYAGHEFRVSIDYGTHPGKQQSRAFSPAAKLSAD